MKIIINDPALIHETGDTNGMVGNTTNISQTNENFTNLLMQTKRSNGTNNPISLSDPITCEVGAQHVFPAENLNNFRADQVEHVNIQSNRKPVRCCVLS